MVCIEYIALYQKRMYQLDWYYLINGHICCNEHDEQSSSNLETTIN